MYVCLSVTGLRLKYTGLRIVFVPFWHMLLMMPSRWRSRPRTKRTEDNPSMSPDVWKMVTVQQKDVRQDNGDKKRLAYQHPSDLLRLLTYERDRQRTARCHLDRTSSFYISNFPRARVRHMMCMHINMCTIKQWTQFVLFVFFLD